MSKTISHKELIKRFIIAHGEKFNYSDVDYINKNIKIKIICPKHGEFFKLPGSFINSKHGCPKCGTEIGDRKLSLGIENFIEKANKKHNKSNE